MRIVNLKASRFMSSVVMPVATPLPRIYLSSGRISA